MLLITLIKSFLDKEGQNRHNCGLYSFRLRRTHCLCPILRVAGRFSVRWEKDKNGRNKDSSRVMFCAICVSTVTVFQRTRITYVWDTPNVKLESHDAQFRNSSACTLISGSLSHISSSLYKSSNALQQSVQWTELPISLHIRRQNRTSCDSSFMLAWLHKVYVWSVCQSQRCFTLIRLYFAENWSSVGIF